MPYPSLFYKIDVKTVKLQEKVSCSKGDKQFLVQVDDERLKAIRALESKDANYQAAIKQIDCYLAVQASYLAFAQILNDKQDKDLFNSYFKAEFDYIHSSPLTQVRICAKPAIIDRYLFNLYYVMTSLDSQLQAIEKGQIQAALARVEFMRSLAPNITIEGSEFLDFKIELLDIFQHLFQGLLLLLGALNAEQQNDESSKNPPFQLQYPYKIVAGIFTYAVQEIELIQTHVGQQDPKNKRLRLPQEFLLFVNRLKAVSAMSMYVYMVLEFNVNPYAYSNVETQLEYCRTRLVHLTEQFDKSASQFDVFNQFFTRNFGTCIENARKQQFLGRNGEVIKFQTQGQIKKGQEFVDYQPSWTMLKPAK